jgi:DUF4097 and DUF4098 domain-containing protein YvlB
MKKITVLVFIALFATVIISAGCFSKRSRAERAQKTEHHSSENKSNDDADFKAREEITQTYQLTDKAEVEVVNISGSVEITTSDSNKAEIHILRLARNKETFEKRKAQIKYENNQLQIRGNDRDNHSIWDEITGDDDLRTRITLKLPRKLEQLSIRGCNGRVNVGDIEGRVEANGINGKVTLAKTAGAVELGGINGKIEVTLAKLAKDGINIHGVNGNIDLKFLEEVNAEVEMHGSNGRVKADLPNVKVTEQKHGRYRATIGTGGPTVEVNGTNGNLWLTRAGTASSASPTPEVTASASPKSVVKKLKSY